MSRRDFGRALGAVALGGGAAVDTAARLVAGGPPSPLALVPNDICFTPAVELAAMIRSKRISAREVMEAHPRRSRA